uniref:hypothetical protein n=1 Tax=Rheinheimera sp. TaxID=1869214 RepID=UPI00404885D7
MPDGWHKKLVLGFYVYPAQPESKPLALGVHPNQTGSCAGGDKAAKLNLLGWHLRLVNWVSAFTECTNQAKVPTPMS